MPSPRPQRSLLEPNTVTVIRRLADHGLRLIEAKAVLVDEPIKGKEPSSLVIHAVQRALTVEVTVRHPKAKRGVAKG